MTLSDLLEKTKAELRTRIALKYGQGRGILLDRDDLRQVYQWQSLAQEQAAEIERLKGELLHSSTVRGVLLDLERRGISFCADLVDEGTPWESVAEPEPQYFATFLEAYDFQLELPSSPTERQEKA